MLHYKLSGNTQVMYTILTLIIYLGLCLNGYPWGQTGHRVIGALAERHLTPTATKTVRSILHGHKLQDVANWADEIRSDQQTLYKSFNKWHFMQAQSAESIQEIINTQQWPTDIQEAIVYCIDMLKKQPEEAKLQRAVLLKMLVHLVGDAHQPLHVGNPNDRGATHCYVRWFYSKFPTTLHKIWDSKLIDAQHYSYTEYTDYLDHISKEDTKAWQQASIQQWLKESRAYHDDVYPINTKTKQIDYCTHDRKTLAYENIPSLGYKYSYQMRPIMEQRLQQAGIRLAGVLNKLFDN